MTDLPKHGVCPLCESPVLPGEPPLDRRTLDDLRAENARLRQAIVALGTSVGTMVMVIEVVDETPSAGKMLLCFPQGDEMAALRVIAELLVEAGTKGCGAPRPVGV